MSLPNDEKPKPNPGSEEPQLQAPITSVTKANTTKTKTYDFDSPVDWPFAALLFAIAMMTAWLLSENAETVPTRVCLIASVMLFAGFALERSKGHSASFLAHYFMAIFTIFGFGYLIMIAFFVVIMLLSTLADALL